MRHGAAVRHLRVSWPLAWALAFLFTLAACGGGTAPAAVEASVPPHPRFQSATGVLVLPTLLVQGRVLAAVELQLASDGTWALRSAGTPSNVKAHDAEAVLRTRGALQDLDSPDLDATLHLHRFHFDHRVLQAAVVRLRGRQWSFETPPTEVAALGLRDFRMNPALAANDAHHVVLDAVSEPTTQAIPVRLRSRNYRFCLDAQADRTVTLALRDANGQLAFELHAGEPCREQRFAAGLYTLERRHTGAGRGPMVFMRPRPAAQSTSPRLADRAALSRSAALARSSSLVRVAAQSLAAGPEYWILTSVGLPGDPPQVLGFFDYGVAPTSNYGGFATQASCFGGFDVGGQVQGTPFWPRRGIFGAGNLLRVQKDGQGNPVGLDGVLQCLDGFGGPGTGMLVEPSFVPGVAYLRYGLPAPWQYQRDFLTNDSLLDFVWDKTVPASLAITNLADNQFNLAVSSTTFSGGVDVARSSAQDGLDENIPARRLMGFTGVTGYPFLVNYRYFPQPSVGTGLPSLGAGQVAIFGQASCQGAMIVTENVGIADMQAMRADLGWSGGSLLLGQGTTAAVYAGTGQQGEAQQLDSSECIAFGFGASGWQPASITIAIDTADIVVSTDACEQCNLGGFHFENLSLQGVKLAGSNLAGATFSGIDLSNADLRQSVLQGTNFVNANLTSANLCGAALNGSAGLDNAAKLSGALLRNANLAYANLGGADFSNASFHSGAAGVCQPASCTGYVAPTCASAYLSTMAATNFAGAYLANVDMSGATATGVNFTNAVLFGASFIGAALDHDATTGGGTSFAGAFLQGADFTDATVRFANFQNAYIEDGGGKCMQARLPEVYTGIPNYRSGSSSAACTTTAAPTGPICVQAEYAAATLLPATDCTNVCPDGSGGQVNATTGMCNVGGQASCPATAWQNPRTPLSGAVLASSNCRPGSALCNPFTSPPNACW